MMRVKYFHKLENIIEIITVRYYNIGKGRLLRFPEVPKMQVVFKSRTVNFIKFDPNQPRNQKGQFSNWSTHRLISADVPVKMLDGTYAKITSGTKVTKVVTIAGSGHKTPIKVVSLLSKKYGAPETEWKKRRGDGFIDVNGQSKHCELHWYEAVSIGKVEVKVKRWLT